MYDKDYLRTVARILNQEGSFRKEGFKEKVDPWLPKKVVGENKKVVFPLEEDYEFVWNELIYLRGPKQSLS